MMRKLLLAMAIVAVSAATSFAADATTGDQYGMPGMHGMTYGEGSAAGGPAMKGGKEGCQKAGMNNPEHLLMMAYHKNVMMFGKALEQMAGRRETVPPEYARAAVAEMRRSVEQMEKYRAGAMAGMPAEMKAPDLQKKIDEHLINVKTQLNELEALTKADTIPSQEILKHVQAIFHECQGMPCEKMHGKGMHEGKGMGGCGHEGKPDCRHECEHGDRHDCGHDEWRHGEEGAEPGMMEHRQMMQEMTRKLKAQDAEMLKMSSQMKKATGNKKIRLMSDLLAKMVQQRAEMTAQMEKMQHHAMEHGGMHHHPGGGAEPGCMGGKGGADEESDSDMDMNDMKMPDAGK